MGAETQQSRIIYADLDSVGTVEEEDDMIEDDSNVPEFVYGNIMNLLKVENNED